MAKNKKEEAQVQSAVSTYIKWKYPDVIFTAESSGVRLTIGQAVQAKANRSDDKLPDMWTLEARGGFFGLFLEIKKPSFDLKKALDPTKVGDRHAKEQEKVLNKLKTKGYKAEFAVGFDQARTIIDSYMEEKYTIPLYQI